MHLFYVPTIASSHVLSEEESQHAVKVLRLNTGDEITVIDGVGGYYQARITNPHHKRCEFEVVSVQHEFGKRSYRLHIAIAPTKNIERLEWFIEKATEIGVDEITPIVCRHSERKVVKKDRLEKIAISASKQSLKAYIPIINDLCTYDEFISKIDATSSKYIAHCYELDKRLFKNECVNRVDVTVLIGPEGDFSNKEVEEALDAGFVPISLGESRLRTETAGVIVSSIVAVMKS